MGSTVPLEWVDRVVAGCAASGGICRRAFYIGTSIGKKRCIYKFQIVVSQRTRAAVVVFAWLGWQFFQEFGSLGEQLDFCLLMFCPLLPSKSFFLLILIS